MKNEPRKSWSRPEFEELGVNGECTAYAGTAGSESVPAQPVIHKKAEQSK